MKIKISLGVAIAAALLLTACHRNHDTMQAVGGMAPPPVTAGGGITLERRPCFGTCPVYTLHIDDGGVVEYNGIRFVSTMGYAKDTLPMTAVRALREAFNRAGYASFAPRYVPGEKVCGMAPTDMPTVITSITTSGVAKVVEHYHGCSDAPPALTQLENQIDSIAQVTRWTRGGSK